MADDADRDNVEREHTTIVETENGDGAGGVLAVVILAIVVLVMLYVFRADLGLGSHGTNISVPNKIDINVNH